MSADTSAETDIEADADGNTDIETDSDVDIGTANTMRERANENWIKLWALLGANRLAISLLLAVIVFVVLVAVGLFFYPAFRADIQSGDTIETVFSSMIGAIITGTTLVLTISQLVISQENGPLGDQHERMSSTMDFREYTSELIGRPMPADPSAFLRHIVDGTEDQAKALRDSVAGSDDQQLRSEVGEFTESVIGNAKQVRSDLEGATFGEFDVLFAALNYNYAWKIFQTERIEHEHGDGLSEEDQAILDELRTTLSMFGPAREHIKTLYFEWALIDLSQLIVYVSVPALLVAGSMLSFVGGNSFPGTLLGVPNILLAFVAAFTITLFPFILLITYVARVATIAKRTLAIGPLILRGSQR